MLNNKISIKAIKISNFRSIVNMDIKIPENEHFMVFVGANNIGKTNILRALALFFGKIDYIPERDCPYYKYYGSRGGNYQPKISLTLHYNKSKFTITKNWNVNQNFITGKKDNINISENEAKKILGKINFFF